MQCRGAAWQGATSRLLLSLAWLTAQHQLHSPQPPNITAAPAPCFPTLPPQTHAILIERYNAAADAWEHVELPPNANPRRSFLSACGLE